MRVHWMLVNRVPVCRERKICSVFQGLTASLRDANKYQRNLGVPSKYCRRKWILSRPYLGFELAKAIDAYDPFSFPRGEAAELREKIRTVPTSRAAHAQSGKPGGTALCASGVRTSMVRNGQSMPVWAALRLSIHAATSRLSSAGAEPGPDASGRSVKKPALASCQGANALACGRHALPQ